MAIAAPAFPEACPVFHGSRLPEPALPVGYAALIDGYRLAVPWPRSLCAIGRRHKRYTADGWRLFTPRHAPAPTLEGHLVFALKYEGLDLCVLKRLFEAVGPTALATLVAAKPTGAYLRRLWFLVEWLLDTPLDLPDAKAGAYVSVVDPRLQVGTVGETSPRHRVRNNLPGTPAFCPLVFRTPTVARFLAADMQARAGAAIARIPPDLLGRTAAYLLLKDTKSSYAIEGETPPQDRLQRWGKEIAEAGRHPLDIEELLRLQRIVLGDDRMVRLGLREDGGFVGERDRDSGLPLPDHISARAEDVPPLIDGLLAFDRRATGLDPVIAATVLAFGFVYIHPFEDGNGRLHRYLVHHALAQRGFTPPGIVFPVSSVMLARIDDYRRALESYSSRLLPHIRWNPTPSMNIRVSNDTADFYRFFDATPQAEFLFDCIASTIDRDLPEEAAFLAQYDRFKTGVVASTGLPAGRIDLLFAFLRQNDGALSKRARDREFAGLDPDRAAEVEGLYREIFSKTPLAGEG